MHLFGLSFILFLFDLSYDPRFWNNIRNSDFILYKRATLTERLAKKLRKHELDLRFLIMSHDEGIYPKCTRLEKLKTHSIKEKNKFSRRILLDEISRSVKQSNHFENNTLLQ